MPELIFDTTDTRPVLIPGYKNLHDRGLITRLEADGNYTWLHLTDKPVPLLVSQTLNYFVPLLPDFIRIHKSTLINPDYVREVIDEGSKQLQLVLADGTVSEVSRRRISETKARLFHYQYDGSKRIWMMGLPTRPRPSWRKPAQ